MKEEDVEEWDTEWNYLVYNILFDRLSKLQIKLLVYLVSITSSFPTYVITVKLKQLAEELNLDYQHVVKAFSGLSKLGLIHKLASEEKEGIKFVLNKSSKNWTEPKPDGQAIQEVKDKIKSVSLEYWRSYEERHPGTFNK